MDPARFLNELRKKVLNEDYGIKSHVLRHAFEEGFEESHVKEAMLNGSILEFYPDQARCLICGRFSWSPRRKDSLHIVIDFGNEGQIDIITAYLPKPPEWRNPRTRGRRK